MGSIRLTVKNQCPIIIPYRTIEQICNGGTIYSTVLIEGMRMIIIRRYSDA